MLSTTLALTLLFSGLASAKDCPSKLPSHTAPVGDLAEVGAEFRGITVAMDPGDALASPNPDSFDLAFMSGLRGLAYIYPTDFLALVLEPEIRYKTPGWEEKAIPGLWPLRFNQALVEIDAGKLGFDVGIQNLAWGTGAVLDTRAIGLSTQYSTRSFKLGAPVRNSSSSRRSSTRPALRSRRKGSIL